MMKAMFTSPTCPGCGSTVLESDKKCPYCGRVLQGGESPPGSGQHSTERKYPALNFVIQVQSLAAWLIAGIIALASLEVFSNSPALGIFGLVGAVIAWVSIMVGAEILQLLKRIEENTRPR